ncbi:MAG: RNB domain-containing ribonuclease, partial [Lentisphaerae bacterium]|nr:RNB domain-containing ribonuclease [Lentisphaerota bacterium]
MTKKNLLTDNFRNKIIELVFDPEYFPLTLEEFTKSLKLRGKAKKSAPAFFEAMLANGELLKNKQGRLLPGKTDRFLKGTLHVFKSGDGIVETSQGEVFIEESLMKTALDGDEIAVDLTRGSQRADADRKYGRVIQILTRSKRVLTGTVQMAGKSFRVMPMDGSANRLFRVTDLKGASVGDRVVIRFDSWDTGSSQPLAEIIEVIGSHQDPALDTLVAVRHFGLPEEFQSAVIKEAEKSAALLDEPGERADFRDKFVFTIDPATARDFDDAISLETNADGKRILGVHIADVSHFVKMGGELDKEAERRGNTVYLPDMVIPMLPEHISNGLCSLRPDEDKLTFSVLLTVDEHGVVEKAEFTKSIIRSRLRLTYEEVLSILDPPEKPLESVSELNRETIDLIRKISRLAQQFRKKRFEALALDLDVPDYEVIVDKNGVILEIKKQSSDFSHQLIEECMVAANEAVDREISKRGFKTLRRIHEAPSPKRIEDLKTALGEMGMKVGDLSKRPNLVKFLASIKGHPLEYFLTVTVLKSMKRAEYSPNPVGHFGLAKTFYAHFTSPIR